MFLDVKNPDGCFDNTVDSDDHCLQFTQTYDWPNYKMRYHSEVLLGEGRSVVSFENHSSTLNSSYSSFYPFILSALHPPQ